MESRIEVRRGASYEDDQVLIGGTPVEIEDGGDWLAVRCEWATLAPLQITPLPADLTIRCFQDEVLPYPFFEIEFAPVDDEAVAVTVLCIHPNRYWEERWGFAVWIEAVVRQAAFHPNFQLIDKEVEEPWKTLVLQTNLPVGLTYEGGLTERSTELKEIIREAEIALGGFEWREEYEKDEKLFATEVLAPLLRRMGFENVRYRHGTREYGKDFTFSEPTNFGSFRHYGLQAKKGDVRGSVNAEIDEIIGQLGDAFAMPYHELTSTEERYISTFVVAISGHFTENAQEKIVNKIPHGLHGSVYFLDREKIQELVERHWR